MILAFRPDDKGILPDRVIAALAKAGASGGTGVTVSDEEILAALQEMARLEGLFAAPEGAATYAGYQKLLESGFLKPEEKVVLFNTGSGLKTPELVQGEYPVLDPKDPDLASKII